MRVSRAQAEQNRDRIIDVAAKLFRERGFDGIGVADLMKAAGLTHGGFYGHFKSKEDLMAQACMRAVEQTMNTLQVAGEKSGEAALATIASNYLSPAHRDAAGEGCVLAALASEASRCDSTVRTAFTAGVDSTANALGQLLPGDLQRERALAMIASMVGAIVLSRAVNDAALSDEVLQSTLKSILGANSLAQDAPASGDDA